MADVLMVYEIVNDYYVAGAKLMENGGLKSTRKAEKLWKEGLAKLDKLDFSPNDRGNVDLLRVAFKASIKAVRALRKGDPFKAKSLIAKAEYAVSQLGGVTANG